MEQLDELSKIRRIVEGETLLFSDLLVRYARPVHALIQRIVLCREDAEELTQDVFLKAYDKLDTWKGDCRFSTWLYRIAYNTAVSATRKRRAVYSVFSEDVLAQVPDDSVDALLDKEDNEQLMQKIEAAFDVLPPEDRALMSLYYLDELSVGEVASILQLTPENVKVRLFRVRKKIYAWVKKNDHEMG